VGGGAQPGAAAGERGGVAMRRHVVVVGGGLAGITAALDCAGAGARVTLVEVRPRLGGAAYSFEQDGMALDNGQHVFLRCCTAYRALLQRLGVEHLTTLQSRLDVPVLAPGGRRANLRRTDLHAPLHLAASLAGYRHLPQLDRAKAAMTALALARLDVDDPTNDVRTFGEWLRAHGASPAAIEALWDLIALPTLNVRASEASLAQAAFVFQTGLLRSAAAADIGWALVPLSELHDAPARRALERAGVDVRLRWRAERVVALPEGGFEVAGPEGPLTGDAVIVALPHLRAGAVLPDGAVPDPGAFERLGKSPIVNVHVHYDRPVLDVPFAAGVQTPVQYVFDRTESAGVERGQQLAVSISGAEEEMRLRPDELKERLLAALAELLPAARSARVERATVTREHAATFRAAPGQRALRPGPRTAVPGLVLAGNWTATGWPATMEGAVRSGHAAAAEALASQGTTAGQREKVAV
jgi:squalene-associated FAD-dependent desaturase